MYTKSLKENKSANSSPTRTSNQVRTFNIRHGPRKTKRLNTRQMAFPASTAQQADVTKKILEDIQNSKKQLLQKGVAPNSAGLTIPQYIQANNQSQPQPGASSDSSINATAKAVLTQALNSSYGFFIAQDSLFGNSIIPVLPRFDSPSSPSTSGGPAGSGSQSPAPGTSK